MTKFQFTFAISLLFSFPVHAEIFMNVDWLSAPMTYKSCILEAKQVLKFSGFEKELDYQRRMDDTQSGSAWGETERGGYKAIVKCVKSEGIVFFVVGGSDSSKVNKYLESLLENFEVPD